MLGSEGDYKVEQPPDAGTFFFHLFVTDEIMIEMVNQTNLSIVNAYMEICTWDDTN